MKNFAKLILTKSIWLKERKKKKKSTMFTKWEHEKLKTDRRLRFKDTHWLSEEVLLINGKIIFFNFLKLNRSTASKMIWSKDNPRLSAKLLVTKIIIMMTGLCEITIRRSFWSSWNKTEELVNWIALPFKVHCERKEEYKQRNNLDLAAPLKTFI